MLFISIPKEYSYRMKTVYQEVTVEEVVHVDRVRPYFLGNRKV